MPYHAMLTPTTHLVRVSKLGKMLNAAMAPAAFTAWIAHNAMLVSEIEETR
jgi:Fe-S cluster biosynthesis and repair protein YggX